jgi:lipid II:glycine glycyltransferase (peptidoglycan interpeptide bridge formation enzyme)
VVVESLRAHDFDKWDRFQMECPRGHYSQLSTWLQSFRKYGGTEEILAIRGQNGEIVAGIGCMSWHLMGMQIWMAPAGPVVAVGREELAEQVLVAAAERARSAGAMALLIQPLVGQECDLQCLLPGESLPAYPAVRMGQRMPGMAVAGMLWVDFAQRAGGADWEGELLTTFSKKTRQHIRDGLKSGLTCSEAEGEEEIRAAFEIIEANGRTQGYATRSWDEFGETITSQVQRGQAVLLAIRHGDRLVGAHYGVLAGRRWSLIMAGTDRSAGAQLQVGWFTNWMAMRKAYERGLSGYDFTSVGAGGVNKFKMGFRPEVVAFVPAQELVFQRFRYGLWVRLMPSVRRHRRKLATITRRLGLLGSR